MSTHTDLPQGPPQGPRRDAGDTHRPVPEQVTRDALRADLGPIRPIGLFTLVRVELRKMFNTRAARWYCFAIAIVLALIITLIFINDSEGGSFSEYFNVNVQTMGYLLPILGILVVTAEWSQRTAMTTFSLEPRRGRVMVAKVFATLLASAATYGLALGLAALGHFASVSLRDGTEDWSLSGSYLGGVALWLLVMLFMGLAFAFLLQSTPGAIVAYLLLPIISTTVFGLVTALEGIRDWVDINFAFGPLLEGNGVSGLEGQEWAQVALAIGIWVVLPFTFGAMRTLRGEVK